jgi:hypothetical protein
MSQTRTATIAQALTQPGPVISVRPDRVGDQQHIWRLPDGRTITVGLAAPLPKHPIGQWVVSHGWTHTRGDREGHGVRGFVIGRVGTSLHVLADDGLDYLVSPAICDPADRVKPWESCPCCPHPPKRAGRPAPAGQGDLLDLIGVA